jgi:hypothetical protein
MVAIFIGKDRNFTPIASERNGLFDFQTIY